MSKKKIKTDRRISLKTGKPPGTLIYTGKKQPAKARITLIGYNLDVANPPTSLSVEEVVERDPGDWVSWYNVDGLSDSETVQQIGTHFEIHPLVLEDIMNIHQMPKAEDHDNILFFTMKMIGLTDTAPREIEVEHISFILGNHFLFSFQEREGDLFDPVRERIYSALGRLRKRKADYLLYALVDTVVDNYYHVIDHLYDDLEELEESVIQDPGPETVHRITSFKQQLLKLKKEILPLREALRKISREESRLVDELTFRYFDDVYDHVLHIIDSMEGMRETLSGFMDLYMSHVSNRMNNVMKTLTIIATIFIPLTFIAGIYGMNFKLMPELDWPWGYPAVWAIMILITLGMLVFFRRQKWL
jgi:magnesium transporter